jgi:hypothetical protein
LTPGVAVRRRRRIAVLIFVALLALAGGLVFAIPEGPAVSFWEYSRVLTGMSRAEVEAIFGGPESSGEPVGFGPKFNGPGVPPGASDKLTWSGHEGHAAVTFDAAGKVIDKSYAAVHPSRIPGPLERRFLWLRDWWRSGGVRE